MPKMMYSTATDDEQGRSLKDAPEKPIKVDHKGQHHFNFNLELFPLDNYF